MADIKFLSGIVSNVSTISSTYGYSSKGTGSTTTSHTSMFRVDNKPVQFPVAINLSEGDEVKVAGFNDKYGELHAVLIKNMTTGVIYSTKRNKWAGTMSICLGVLVCLFIITIPIGIFLIIFGIVHITECNRNEKLLRVM
jgi:hypothetical protein